MSDKTHTEYVNALIIHYTQRKLKSGMEWHDWVAHQMEFGKLTITEAHDILCELYRRDPRLTIYCDVASYYFYRRINRPDIFARFWERVGSVIAPYVVS